MGVGIYYLSVFYLYSSLSFIWLSSLTLTCESAVLQSYCCCCYDTCISFMLQIQMKPPLKAAYSEKLNKLESHYEKLLVSNSI